MADKHYHLLGVSEDWLTAPEAEATRVGSMRTVSTFWRQTCRHGGSMILSVDILETINLEYCNAVSQKAQVEICGVHIKKLNVTFINIYRPPGGDSCVS